MPELPEVETTLRGIAPSIVGRRVAAVAVRNSALRQPVPAALPEILHGRKVVGLRRRGKYLLMAFRHGHLLLHLGMSGSLRIVPVGTPPGRHDHLDIAFSGNALMRFNDPRRFGLALWVEGDPCTHPLLRELGPEPLSDDFDGDYLYRRARGRATPVKAFLMDGKVVVGVGNIYAAEALFMAGVSPLRAAGKISRARFGALAEAARLVLSQAIEQGGTTLRNFVGGDGKPGYFKQQLNVYGRGGEACSVCRSTLKSAVIGQRSSVYCPRCQR